MRLEVRYSFPLRFSCSHTPTHAFTRALVGEVPRREVVAGEKGDDGVAVEIHGEVSHSQDHHAEVELLLAQEEGPGDVALEGPELLLGRREQACGGGGGDGGWGIGAVEEEDAVASVRFRRLSGDGVRAE